MSAPEGAQADFFGNSVAISGDGQRALVGAFLDEVDDTNIDQGRAYIYLREDDGSWTEEAQITAGGTSALLYLNFGNAVSMDTDGSTALVGAFLDDVGATTDQGSAFVFQRGADGAWTQEARLVASDGLAFDNLGTTVSISGDGQYALLGSPLSDVGGIIDHGSAYVFARGDDGVWTEQAKLLPDDGSAADTTFGNAVSISADGMYAVVGSVRADIEGNVEEGAAYVYMRDGMAWSQVAKLTADDGAAFDHFGEAVSISDDAMHIAVSSVWQDVDGNDDQGSVYLFTRQDDGSWMQEAQVTGSGTATSSWPNLGNAISLDADGSRLLAGAELDDITGDDTNEGRAYLFYRNDDGTWSETGILLGDDTPAANDFFGSSVSLSDGGNYALVGSIYDDDPQVGGNNDYGAAFVFGPAAMPVDAEEPGGLESGYHLGGVYPNPLRGSGTVELTVPTAQHVTMTLHDLLGRELALIHDDVVPAGAALELRIEADALPSGVYLVRAVGDGFTSTQRFVLVH